MTLPAVNISSDSDSSSSDASLSIYRKGPKIRKIVTDRKISLSDVQSPTPATNNADNQAAADARGNKSVNEAVPLFKITFRDELTSGKYRRRIEDIIKYVLASPVDEGNDNAAVSDLTEGIIKYVLASSVDEESHDAAVSDLALNIFDPMNGNKTSDSMTTGTVSKQLKNVDEEHTGSNKFAKKAKRKRDEDAESPQLKKILKNPDAENKGQSSVEACKGKIDESYVKKRNLRTSFSNNSVKIGSFGYFIQDKTIFISKDGLTIFGPPLKKKKQLRTLSIGLNEIEKVLVCFSKIKPALFFFVSTKTGEEIRKLLNMDDPDGPYFDPASKNLGHQHIAILPEQISDKSKNVMHELFKNITIEEISEKAAADLIQIESTTKELNDTPEKNKILTKKTKQNSSITPENDESNKNKTMKESTVLNSDGHADKRFKIVTLFCHIVRVGSYEHAKNRVFSMSSNGIKFCVPLVDNASSMVTINIDIDEIVKIAVTFSEVLPVIFCYISTKAASRIREMLHMNDPNELCIDPDSEDDTRNKIIIFPQQVSPDCKAIKELLRLGKVEELDDETAKAIIRRSICDNKKNEPEIIEPRVMERSAIVDVEYLYLGATRRMNFANIVSRKKFLHFNISLIDLKLSFQVNRSSQDIHLRFGDDVIKTEFHLSTKVKALFFRITTSCAITIRSKLLKLHNTNNGDPYFGRSHKTLAIVFKALTKDQESTLTEILMKINAHSIREKKAISMTSKRIVNPAS